MRQRALGYVLKSVEEVQCLSHAYIVSKTIQIPIRVLGNRKRNQMAVPRASTGPTVLHGQPSRLINGVALEKIRNFEFVSSIKEPIFVQTPESEG